MEEEVEIWSATNIIVRVYASLRYNQFFATLTSKYGDTFFTVGYSSPNGADVRYLNPRQIKRMHDTLDAWWNKQDFSNVFMDQMLPYLLDLCKIANNEYNKL